MKLTQWTFFLDLLGFSEANKTITSDSEAEKLLEFLESNKEILDLQNSNKILKNYSQQNFNLYEFYEVKHAIISDSIVITFKPKETKLKNTELQQKHSANAFLIIILRLHTLMANCLYNMGFLIRGGISSEYCDIKGSTASGLGLSNAHTAESKIAIYPRIALNKDIPKQTIRRINWLFKEMYGEKELIYKTNGNHFVNSLNFLIGMTDAYCQTNIISLKKDPSMYIETCKATRAYLEKQKIKIEAELTRLRHELEKDQTTQTKKSLIKIAKKYIWLKRHHNKAIKNNKQFSEQIIATLK